MKKLSFLLGLIISVIFSILLFYKINLATFLNVFKSANYFYVIPIIMTILLGCYLRAVRWYWILQPLKPISISSLFSAVVIGYMGNNLLPARMGELLRAHVIGRREGISRASSFATIIVERLFDGLSILVILVPVLLMLKIKMHQTLVAASLLVLLLYLGVIVLIWLFNYKKELVLRIFGLLLPKFVRQKVLDILELLAQGFKIIEKGHHLLIISFYSLLIWLVTAFSIYLTVYSFGCQISFAASLFVLFVLTFAVMIPSSPGFVGTFDAGMAYALILFAVSRETAIGVAVLYHGLNFLPIVGLGFYYMWKYNLKLLKTNEI